MDGSEFEEAAFCGNVVVRDSFQVFQAAIASELRRMQTTIDELHTQLASEALSTQHNVPDEYLQDVVKATVRELTAHRDDDETKQHEFDQSLQFVPDADLKEHDSQPVQLKVADVGNELVAAKGLSTEDFEKPKVADVGNELVAVRGLSTEDFEKPCDSYEPPEGLDGNACLDEPIGKQIHVKQSSATSLGYKPSRTSVKKELGEEVADKTPLTRGSLLKKHIGDRRMLALDIAPSVVIFLNTFTLGFSLEFYAGHKVWDFIELIFLSCYILEAIMKIHWFGLKFYTCGPDWAWHWFDMFIILISIIDLCFVFFFSSIQLNSAAISLTKVLRLARLARLVRGLRFSMFDELKSMVFGVMSGLRTLFWAVVLLMLCIYVFGVATMSLLGTEEPEFGSLVFAMFTTFRCFTDGCSAADGTPLHHTLTDKYGVVFMIPYILSFMLVTVGVFNLIMAIFIESVMAGSTRRNLESLGKTYSDTKTEITNMFYNQMMQHPEDFSQEQLAVLTALESVADLTDRLPGDVSISRERFHEWMQDDQVREVLKMAEVETSNMSELFDVLDVDCGGELGVDELIIGIMRMRGPITKADIIAIRLKVGYLTNLFETQRRASKQDTSAYLPGIPLC